MVNIYQKPIRLVLAAILIFSIEHILLGEGEVEKKLWNFNLSVGLSANSGNTEKSQFNGSIAVSRKEYPVDLSGRIDLLYGQSEGVTDANRGKLIVNYDRYFSVNWEGFLFDLAEYDRLTQIDLRNDFGIGIKYEFYKSKSNEISLSGAVVGEVERFTDRTEESSYRLSLRPKVKIKISETAEVYLMSFYLPKLGSAEDYRVETNIFLKTLVRKNIWFKLTIFDRYDNIVKPGVKKNDFSLISGLEFQL
jgi:hypothetical protein